MAREAVATALACVMRVLRSKPGVVHFAAAHAGLWSIHRIPLELISTTLTGGPTRLEVNSPSTRRFAARAPGSAKACPRSKSDIRLNAVETPSITPGADSGKGKSRGCTDTTPPEMLGTSVVTIAPGASP